MKRTIDREQERARLRADRLGPDARAGRDLAWIVVACVAVGGVLVATGSLAGIADRVRDRPTGDLAVLGGVLVVVAAVAGALGARGYRRAGRDRETLRRLSYHDALTGLPNRRFLGEGFDRLLKQVRRTNGRIAVVFVDLHGLSEVNANLGPATGDQLIVAAAERLGGAVGRDDRVVRYGGAQFVLFCRDVSTAMSAERLARSVLDAIGAPFEVGGSEVHLAAHIGVAITEERCAQPDEVLRDADAALAQARQEGPGSLVLFDRAVRDHFTPSTAERRLREALDAGEFRLYYQPLISLWTKRLVGVEALLRWNEPRRGLLGPDQFLHALEETGLIVPIGTWVLEEVARQSRSWAAAFPERPALNVKVNVSGRQLAQANFLAQLRQLIDATGVDAAHLYLEISESSLQPDPEAVWGVLRDAKALGLSLALDDFGTGYSSLRYLRRLGLDMLTVDRSFVEGLGHSAEDTTIVEHLIGMAKALGIVTVAEGVEHEEQVEQLRRLNCDLAQGYFYSHPQPPYVITELLGRSGDEEWHPPVRDEGSDDDAATVVVDARFTSAPG